MRIRVLHDHSRFRSATPTRPPIRPPFHTQSRPLLLPCLDPAVPAGRSAQPAGGRRGAVADCAFVVRRARASPGDAPRGSAGSRGAARVGGAARGPRSRRVRGPVRPLRRVPRVTTVRVLRLVPHAIVAPACVAPHRAPLPTPPAPAPPPQPSCPRARLDPEPGAPRARAQPSARGARASKRLPPTNPDGARPPSPARLGRLRARCVTPPRARRPAPRNVHAHISRVRGSTRAPASLAARTAAFGWTMDFEARARG